MVTQSRKKRHGSPTSTRRAPIGHTRAKYSWRTRDIVNPQDRNGVRQFGTMKEARQRIGPLDVNVSLGGTTSGRDWRRREDGIPHVAFRYYGGLPHPWRHPRNCVHRGRYVPNRSHGTYQPKGTFLNNPGLWIGLAVAGAFLGAAVHLRRSKEPS